MEDEFNLYLANRNLLVHGFWENYLNIYSVEQVNNALVFCNNFGESSEKIEKYFKGLLYMLALRFVEDSSHLDDKFKVLEDDFKFFLSQQSERNL